MIKKVLLSAKIDPDDPDLAMRQLESLNYPVMLSPKIDGIRCHVEAVPSFARPSVLSRKNKAIPNLHVRSVLACNSCLNLDGELAVGRANTLDCYPRTMSAVMSRGGDPDFKFLVFDWTRECDLNKSFEERYSILTDVFSKMNKFLPVKLVPQKYVYSVEELLRYEARMLAKGWEGIMIRSPRGYYKQNRSTLSEQILIKVKRFIDGEAQITGVYEQETNLNEAVINEVGNSKRSSHKANKVRNGHLGGFHVKDLKTGIEFDIGTLSGVTKVQRKLMWEGFEDNPDLLLGKVVKYKHFPIGAVEKPRNPILLGFRSSIDLGDDSEDTE